MRNIPEISTIELKKEIALAKNLQKRKFTESVYRKRCEQDDRVDLVLRNFEEGILKLQPDQYRTFAIYISVCGHNNIRHLEQLQTLADFDVKQYVAYTRRKWWQKLFNIDPNKVDYLSASELQKMINKYLETQDQINKGIISKRGYTKNSKLYKKGQEYIKAYLEGNITVKPEDRHTFKKFIKVMDYPIYEGCLGDRAIKKLEKEKAESSTVATENTPKTSKWTLFKQRWQEKMASVKQSSQEKFSAFKKKSPLYGTIALGATVVAASVVMLFSKSSSPVVIDETKAPKTEQKIAKAELKIAKAEPKVEKNEQKIAKTEQKAEKTITAKAKSDKTVSSATKTENKQDTLATYHWQPVADTKVTAMDPLKSIQPESQKQESEKETVVDSRRQARINHHTHVLEMRLGKEKSKHLIDVMVKDQLDKGIISLPDSLGKEDLAYALEMYHAYEIECSLDSALTSQTKLSKTENDKVINDIISAGETGLGVKKMAMQKYHGKLNHNSVYDHASAKSQKQHKLNLKQLRQIKKSLSRAA